MGLSAGRLSIVTRTPDIGRRRLPTTLRVNHDGRYVRYAAGRQNAGCLKTKTRRVAHAVLAENADGAS